MLILDYIRRFLSERYDLKKVEEELSLLKRRAGEEWNIRYKRYRGVILRYELEMEKVKGAAASIIHHATIKERLEEKLTNEIQSEEVRYIIISQEVGTFYSSSKEGTPYIKVGDKISEGAQVGRIEFQKLEYEVKFSPGQNIFKVVKSDNKEKSEKTYFEKVTVEKILVENGYPVEYGQELLEIEPC